LKNINLNGTGIGFRMEHADQILSDLPNIPWFEILVDNYMAKNALLSVIDDLAENYPLTFHGVGLSIGSITPIDYQYLKNLKRLKERWQPVHISDHFAWTRTNKHNFHELLPLPPTEESVKHLVGRIGCIQEFMQEQILLENASTYVEVEGEMTEWDFINEVCFRSGCALLLDVNNIHVNAFNHQFDVGEYIENIDLSLVKEIHLAGYEDRGDYYFDSHGEAVHSEVWNTYSQIIEVIPNTPALIEWDNNLPELSTLILEAQKSELIRRSTLRNNQMVEMIA